MKKLLFLFITLSCYVGYSQITINPNPFNTDESITITLDLNNINSVTDCNNLNNPTKIYLHSGIGEDSDPWGFGVVGNWGQDDGVGEMTNNGNGVWSITFIPETYYSLNATQATNATKMGMVFRSADGSQELKDNGCSDFFINVGSFQVTLTNPTEGSTTVLSTNSFNIAASNTNGVANYQLYANGSLLNSNSSTSNFTYTHTGITSNQNYVLDVTQAGTTLSKTFAVIIDPNVSEEALPANLDEGINYNENDNTKAILVLDAPNKDFVYVAGSFNNWSPDTSYGMKKDPSSSKFWLELTGLTSGVDYTYQYWVVDESPIANSPVMVKTADPFSTLVLSPFDDPGIPSNSYPNMPTYPVGQEREVTVLKTGQTPYNWQVTNFTKPAKEDLVIYEVLIRDFDANRNYQDLIDRIDYFKNLNVNAIQLMPVMEYEGNESWGYNTSFHMALDKYYGTEDKLKEFIDLCHQNDIAVILDIALNHAFGRNPMVRMWMEDPDGDGWGSPSTENPYFNTVARHSYNVGEDFNHQQPRTQKYVQNVIKHWVEDFNIDGFRWDLTKGFTQNCTASDEGCTNSYQQDRVDVLKDYADYSWSLDESHYVIFEHLGSATEEQQWANYRLTDAVSKGIMMWGKMTDPYNQLTMGYASNSNINRMGSDSRGFDAPRLVGYAESHDEERLMYKNLQYGNSNASYDVQDLDTSLARMSALGAVTLTIPGPKMIWHFGDLGMQNSIFTCSNGTVNTPDGTDGDCKLDTKPQPQWTDDWLGITNRNQIYNDWARLNDLKVNEPVFEGSYTIESGNLTPRIHIWDDAIPSNQLKDVIIITNFDVVSQNINPNFPNTGTWFELMDETGSTSIEVSNTTSPITIAPGQFKIFGNASTLSTQQFTEAQAFKIYPNPAHTSFRFSQDITNVEIYDITGKLIQNYSGNFSRNNEFDITSLNSGIYIIKAQNISGGHLTTKLVKI
ncbi:alpha-amylase family glycosyl hydrolase [Bizionia arctica]|nr:alpha-amylase family glycosyl hydrolase [Bizionia arctica]